MRNEAPVIIKLLRAVGHFDPSLFADELVVRALVHILKAAPPADVEDEDVTKICLTGQDVVDQLGQTIPVLNFQARSHLRRGRCG
jgi:hypothetical protein